MYNLGKYSEQSLPCLSLILGGQSLENKSGYLPSLLPHSCLSIWAFLVAQAVKNLPAMQETWVLIPGWVKSPGDGNDNTLQHSCLGTLMDRGAWWATVHGAAKSQTRLRGKHCHLSK